MIIVHIDSGYFNAGVIIKNGKVIDRADILHYMMGWTSKRVVNYAKKKGWKIEASSPAKPNDALGS